MPGARQEALDAAAGGGQLVAAEQGGGRQQHLAKALESSHLWVQLDAPEEPQEKIEREVSLVSPRRDAVACPRNRAG